MSEPQGPPPRHRLRWLLVALLSLVVVVVGVTVFFLMQRGPDPVPVQTQTGGATVSATPSPSVTVSPLPTASPTSTGAQPPAPDLRAADFADAMTSGNTAALEQELANPTLVVKAASGCCGEVDPTTAISLLNYVNPGTGPTWNFAVDQATLESYRSGEYAQYFPPEAVVGVSSDGYVVSFVPNAPGGSIVIMLMALPGVL